MKKLNYLLIFVLAVFCIAGCGKKETETKEKGTVVDKDYIKFTLKEGWEMDDKSGDANNLTGSIYLANVGSQNILRPTIRFEYRRGDTPKEELEFWKGMYNTTKRMDNVTIKGTEYMVLNNDSPMEKNNYLIHFSRKV